MSLNSSFAPGRFSVTVKFGLIPDETLCCGRSRHQFGIFLGMCFKALQEKRANN